MAARETTTPHPPESAVALSEPAVVPILVRTVANRALLLLGLFQVIVGVALLMVPHRFSIGPFAGWLDQPLEYGALALLAGATLLWIRILPIHRRSVVVAGLALTILNWGLAIAQNTEGANGHWLAFFATGAFVSFAMLVMLARGRATISSTLVGRRFGLAAVTSQLAALVTGVLMLGYPVAYSTDVFDDLRPWLTEVGGVLWVLGGTLLAGNLLVGRKRSGVLTAGNALLAIVWGFVAVQLGAQGS